jgi:uncharacterized protein YhbP (UPF0306 family)
VTGSTAGLAEPDRAALLALLEETPALTLATLDPDGAPRATPLFFAADDLALIFLSDPSSQHSHNLLADPRCGVGLYPAVDDWRALRGLQLRGQARRLREAEAPFAADLTQAIEAAAPFRFQPSWIRRIDNRQGFGFQQEWHLDE